VQRISAAGVLGGSLAIALVLCGSAAAFAYTAGWLAPQRLTPARMVDALSARGGDPVGHRRNHAKGVCFTGIFSASGEGLALSSAPMFHPGEYPVIGRFAIATGDPHAPDATGRVRSMAIRIIAGGQEWRSGMNNSPVFAVTTPAQFYAQTLAQRADPETGKPDPAAIAQFAKSNPESAAFNAWAKSAPWTASFADQQYNSLNAFYFTNAAGTRRAVRWSMQPGVAPVAVSHDALAKRGPDFLESDLKERLAHAPLRWDLVVTVAAPGDATNDATLAWPASRERVPVGTLVVREAEDEANGPCRDINYDPTILPTGMAISDDPLLAARSSAYANSFDRRITEEAVR
jgi:catalase